MVTPTPKTFIPLESNPDVFTKLIRDIGVMSCIEFRDVYSISEPSLLALLPRPALALILVGPTEAESEMLGASEEPKYAKSGDNEDIMWLKQTIPNACGLYSILHAVCNGPAREFIEKDSILDKLITTSRPLPPDARAQDVEACDGLERAYESAAMTYDQTTVPQHLEDLGNHYLCLVKSHKNGHLYQVSGSRNGPVDKGLVPAEEDPLGPTGAAIVQNFLDFKNNHRSAGFSLIALVPSL